MPQPLATTAAWLTSALREGGAIQDTAVKSFESEIVGEGAGFIGQLARLTLDYDHTDEGAPASLIAKFPSPVAENREVGDVYSVKINSPAIRLFDASKNSE